MAVYIENDNPKATLIPQSEILVNGISEVGGAPFDLNFHVTGWGEPRHTLTSHIGTEPLEDGSLITDHVIAFPPKVSMKGYVSDVIEGGAAPEKTWDAIRDLHANEILMNILTEWGFYKDMVIRMAETKQTGRGMEFMMEFQHVVRVGLDVIKIFNPKNTSAEPERWVYVVVNAEGNPVGFNPQATNEDGVTSGAFFKISDEDVNSILNKYNEGLIGE